MIHRHTENIARSMLWDNIYRTKMLEKFYARSVNFFLSTIVRDFYDTRHVNSKTVLEIGG